MSINMNSVIIGGNLVRDPEIRYTPAGKAVANFTLAVNEGWGDKKTTLYVDIVAWEKTAEAVSQYCGKGMNVVVEGRLQKREWEKDGEKKSKMEVVATRVHFGNKADGQAQGQKSQPEPEPLGKIDADPF